MHFFYVILIYDVNLIIIIIRFGKKNLCRKRESRDTKIERDGQKNGKFIEERKRKKPKPVCHSARGYKQQMEAKQTGGRRE